MKVLLILVAALILVQNSIAEKDFEENATPRLGRENPLIKDLKLVVITVATDQTDGYLRFMRSADLYGLNVEVFGMKQEWLGGDIATSPGGGHKINILKQELKKYATENNTVLMFTDSYDVIFTAGYEEIIKKFLAQDANIVFSAENFCWPDANLAPSYPHVKEGYRFLCSGGIIGYAPTFYSILNEKAIEHTDDDQLYYSKIYLSDNTKYKMKLDYRANIFQNLNGNQDDVELNFRAGDARIKNKVYDTMPCVIHGNGPSKLYLNHLDNYIAKSWNFEDGCTKCKDGKFSLAEKKEEDYPRILIGIFIEFPIPFMAAMLEHISNLNYPKSKIDIFIHNAEPHHTGHVDTWMAKHKGEYASITMKGPRDFMNEMEARNMGLYHCFKVNCDYYFNVDGDVTLSNRDALTSLIEQNRTFIVPMISKPGKLWSNFWGSIGKDGFYARSPDFIDIVKLVRRGIWNSPFVNHIYLIKSSTVNSMPRNPFYAVRGDADMAFCKNMRDKGIFMYVTNLEHFGHLKETKTYTTNFKHNDLYQLFDNRLDWEEKYLHPEYTSYLDENGPVKMPCPDVYWYPFVTQNYTREMIEECEHFGKWSGGGHKDERISGGYENVPTVDIHMNQIGFEKAWLQMLKDYVAPMATRFYPGYHSHSQAIMNFVVKYTTNGQYFLRPHHDASTFTINMALNTAGVDYEGGGSNFLRYNCSVSDTKVGWALLHPGRLTHYHEGLPITQGQRYIMVSFVDP